MVDSDKSKNGPLASDDKLRALYRASLDQETEIPAELEASILEQARSHVANQSRPKQKPKSGPVTNLTPKRRRWEIPASIAATFIFATLLFINNRDELPAIIDTGIPTSKQSESQRSFDAGLVPQEIPHGDIESEQIVDQASPAAAMMEQAPIMSESKAPTMQMEAKSGKAFKKARQPSPLPEKLKSAPIIQDALAPGAPQMLMEPSLEKSIAPAAEVQRIDPESWLSHIQQLMDQGLIEQAQTELIAFQAHFPDYSLREFCAGHKPLCEKRTKDEIE